MRGSRTTAPWAWVLATALGAAACSPGPGRLPHYPDATVHEDAWIVDAAPYDSGPYDAGPQDVPVTTFDSGPPPHYKFTGVYDITGASQRIYAREVDGQLSLIVGDFPFAYVGTITEDGQVDVTSPTLMASGCLVARITGQYGRQDALFSLLQETCNGQLMPVVGNLTGGFNVDFDWQRSGVYELEATVIMDPAGCYGGSPTGHTVRYGISFLSNRRVAVFTGVDIIEETANYIGQASFQDWSFSALHWIEATGTTRVGMSGWFQAVSANEPVQFSGERDVYNPTGPAGPCTFRMRLDGIRVELP